MDDYRDHVERLALARTGEPCYNSSIDHAAVIIEKMFRHAKKEVCIVTKQLNGRVFGQDEVVREAKLFLSNAGHNVRILMEDEVSSLSEGHPLVEELRQHPKGYSLRVMPESLRDKLKFHFTLADDNCYRFEPDKNEWEAVAVFGDNLGANNLLGIFDSIWSKSKEASFPEVAN